MASYRSRKAKRAGMSVIKLLVPLFLLGVLAKSGLISGLIQQLTGTLKDSSTIETIADKYEQLYDGVELDEIKVEDLPDTSTDSDDNAFETASDDDSSVYVEFIDVGQGDSILIKDEKTMLIDTGAYSAHDNVVAAIEAQEIPYIDYLVLTHPDADHIQSAPELIMEYDIKTIYMPDFEKETKTYDYLVQAIDLFGCEVITPLPGDTINLGKSQATVLGPMDKYSDANSNSIILKLVNGNDSFLFTGDATGEETDEILASGINVSADVLKAAHHGSANDGCNSEVFLNAVSPETMIISCGIHNEYGHPHRETMDYAKNMSITLYRTDLQGSVSCKSTGNGIIFTQPPSDNYTNGNNM